MSGPIMLATGGTGGHVFPAQALAAELGRRGRRVDIVTDRRGAAFGRSFGDCPVHGVSADTPSDHSPIGKVVALLRIARGTLQARGLIRRLAPDAVVGFGGYPALPAMLAAASLSVPRAIHEQNAVLGKVNRLLAGRVDAIAASFAKTRLIPERARDRITVTGNPVRSDIAAAGEHGYRPAEAAGPFELLVFGGSQGARVLSQVVPAAIARLPEASRGRLRVTQQCRPEDLDEVARQYQQCAVTADLAEFYDDLADRLAAAHLVVARAGAGSVSDLAAAGRPSILVPYIYAADDHQTVNADALAGAGGAWLLPQAQFSAETLASRLAELMDDPDALATAAGRARAVGRPDAAHRLADLVLDLAAGSEGRAVA